MLSGVTIESRHPNYISTYIAVKADVQVDKDAINFKLYTPILIGSFVYKDIVGGLVAEFKVKIDASTV
jgi:hypothetical protein